MHHRHGRSPIHSYTQTIEVVVDSGSFDLTVATTDCLSCSKHHIPQLLNLTQAKGNYIPCYSEACSGFCNASRINGIKSESLGTLTCGPHGGTCSGSNAKGGGHCVFMESYVDGSRNMGYIVQSAIGMMGSDLILPNVSFGAIVVDDSTVSLFLWWYFYCLVYPICVSS